MSSKKKTETKLGNYCHGYVCTECDWTQTPDLTSYKGSPCPKCGGVLNMVVGRWLYGRTKGWLFWSMWCLVKFIPKDKLEENQNA